MVLQALLIAAALTSTNEFYARGPYDASVPRPEAILGYGPGERHTTYLQQESVVQAIVSKSAGKVRYFQYGKSVEGRPLRVLAISNPKNIARLEEIRKDIASLATGDAKDAEAIIRRTPAIFWINQTIHGNETASFESSMWLLYNLVASRSPDVQRWLDRSVVILNPCYNPDGHERYVVWYNSIAVGDPRPEAFEQREPRVVHGRTNHYRFDMNRDRIAMSQDETRQEVAEYLRWNPQVYVDQHGQVDTYFFPPAALSINANVDRERFNKWSEIFGRATAKAFDERGYLYFIKDTYDFYAPGYLDSWTTFSGSIGMTHETDGGPPLARARRDGTLRTLKGGMEKHLTSALAVLDASTERKDDLLSSYYSFKRKAATGQHVQPNKRFVLIGGEHWRLLRLQSVLSISAIRSRMGEAPGGKGLSFWTGKEENVPAGSYLEVDLAQPQGWLAKTLLEQETQFEPEFIKEQLRRRELAMREEQYPRPEGSEFYDVTGWSLPLAHGLRAWWSGSSWVPAIQREILRSPAADTSKPTVGWVVYPGEREVVALGKLMASGVRAYLAPTDARVGSLSYPAGSYLILRARNDEGLDAKVQAAAKSHPDVTFIPLATGYPEAGRYGPGLDPISLRKPEIGIVFGDEVATTYYGSIWYLMDRVFKLPFTPLHKSALSGDLSKYSTIVFPDGRYDAPSDKLKEWISNGGCAVVLGGDWAVGQRGFFALDQVKGANDKNPASLPGTLFKAELDPRSFLSYGYRRNGEGKIEIAVPVEGSTFFKARKEGGGAVVFSSGEEDKVLSGWVWPDDTEKALRGTVWLHDHPMGNGRVVWFAQDPSDRAMWPGLYGLLLNAMILGPRP